MGERFGSYEIQEKLGEGGMAEVFSAVRRGEDGFVRRVCIKRMLPEHEADPAMVELFGDEARIMAGLHHPAIVSVLELGKHQGRSFLAMELVDGVDLRKILRRTGPLAADHAVLVAHELASALDHAHRATVASVAMRVVHRDVTPSNVLVSKDGTIKLTDFGIAKASERAHVTQAGIVKGKVPYMSPEQALGSDVDHRADLFSLGVVLFESLAGRRPYDGPTDLDTLRNVQCGQHLSLAELVPSVPRALVDIVHKLLRPRREDRFESASKLLDALAPLGALAARRALEKRVARAIEMGPQPKRARVEVPVPAVTARRPMPTPVSSTATRTELMAPTAIHAIEALGYTPGISQPSFHVAVVVEPMEDTETTEVAPRHEPSQRAAAIPSTRPSDRKSAPVIQVGVGAFVAFTVAWLAISAAAGALWALASERPEMEPTTLAAPP